jgi:hypothetical protein
LRALRFSRRARGVAGLKQVLRQLGVGLRVGVREFFLIRVLRGAAGAELAQVIWLVS